MKSNNETVDTLNAAMREALRPVEGCLLSSEWGRDGTSRVWNTTPSYSTSSLNAAVALGLAAYTGAQNHWRLLTPEGLALRNAWLNTRVIEDDG